MTILRIFQYALTFMTFMAPAHQAFVELYKLTGRRVRHYYDAMFYVIYGSAADAAELESSIRAASDSPEQPTPPFTTQYLDAEIRSSHEEKPLTLREQATLPTRLVPDALGPGLRREWAAGSVRNLIESFALRAVGDNPVSEISDSDVQNVIRVVRLRAPKPVRHTIESLNAMIETGEKTRENVSRILGNIDAGPLRPTIQRWLDQLKQGSDAPVQLLLGTWRRELIETNLSAELRARVDLGNSLKSAEYRYHQDIRRASVLIAVVEGIALGTLAGNGQLADLGTFSTLDSWIFGILCFGFLLVLPQASKGILDIITGLATRIKP